MTLRLTRLEWERKQARRRGNIVATAPAVENRGSRWEEEFAAQLDEAGYAGRYRREYRFLPDRRFRFDFAFVPERLAVEIDGAVHRIKQRFQGDREKGQLAILGGWTVLHVGPDQVRSGEAISLLKTLLKVSHG